MDSKENSEGSPIPDNAESKELFEDIEKFLKDNKTTKVDPINSNTPLPQEIAPITGKVILSNEKSNFTEEQELMLDRMNDLRTLVAGNIVRDKHVKISENIDEKDQLYALYERTIETSSGTLVVNYLSGTENNGIVRLRLLDNKLSFKKVPVKPLYDLTIEKGGYFSVEDKQGIYSMDENEKPENIHLSSSVEAEKIINLYLKNKSKNPLMGNLVSFLFRRHPQPPKISKSTFEKFEKEE